MPGSSSVQLKAYSRRHGRGTAQCPNRLPFEQGIAWAVVNREQSRLKELQKKARCQHLRDASKRNVLKAIVRAKSLPTLCAEVSDVGGSRNSGQNPSSSQSSGLQSLSSTLRHGVLYEWSGCTVRHYQSTPNFLHQQLRECENSLSQPIPSSTAALEQSRKRLEQIATKRTSDVGAGAYAMKKNAGPSQQEGALGEQGRSGSVPALRSRQSEKDTQPQQRRSFLSQLGAAQIGEPAQTEQYLREEEG